MLDALPQCGNRGRFGAADLFDRTVKSGSAPTTALTSCRLAWLQINVKLSHRLLKKLAGRLGRRDAGKKEFEARTAITGI